jgi:metal-responsive CopG/Arc/MetJ family transcriptional regulator
MARTTINLPDDLYRKLQDELPPGVSWSAVCADALREKLSEASGCAHDVLRCASCGVKIERTGDPA